jgi:hypothetical protein
MAHETAADVLSAKVRAADTATTESTAHMSPAAATVTAASTVTATASTMTATTSTVTATATPTGQCASRNGGTSQCDRGNNDSDFVQHQHFHQIAFLSDPGVAHFSCCAGTRRASSIKVSSHHPGQILARYCGYLTALAATSDVDQYLPSPKGRRPRMTWDARPNTGQRACMTVFTTGSRGNCRNAISRAWQHHT